MRICFVCSEYPPGPHGGIGSFTQVMARLLSTRGHAVRVVGIYSRNYPGELRGEDCGVAVWRLRVRQYKLSWVVERRKLYSVIKDWVGAGEIDVVEVPDWGGWAAWWPKFAAPVVARLHGSSTYFRSEAGGVPDRLTAVVERASLLRADAWCTVSRYTGDVTRKVLRLARAEPAVLYNPVDVPAELNHPERRDPHLVVYSGTLTPKKGVVQLIDAWPGVLQAVPSSRLVLLGKDGVTGDGRSMRRFLEGRLPEEARGSVSFRGPVPQPEVLAMLSTARAGVFPSFAESFGLAAVESMACGCPTIYTKRSCGPEIIRPDIDGLLVDPEQPREIAAAIIRLLRDDDLWQRLSRSGQERVRREFAPAAVVSRNEQFYTEAIGAFHRARM